MLNLKYLEDTVLYPVSFSKISKNVVQVLGDIPVEEKGFILTRIDNPEKVIGDYSAYTTIYRKIDGGVQFSNDESVYVEPEPEPTPEPEPYIPTLEDVIEQKVAEVNATQQSVIQQGVDVTLSDGTVEHFTLSDHDQTSLMGLQTKVLEGEEQIPWHTSDQTEHCKYYSNADMAIITQTALQFVTYHVTYFRDLRIYIRALETKEEVAAIYYGIAIPEEYQSEPLKDMLAQLS